MTAVDDPAMCWPAGHGLRIVSRDVISDETWAVIGPLFPQPKATGRPLVDRRTVVEATGWRYRTGAP